MLLDSSDYNYTSSYQMVSFTDKPYIDAYNSAIKQSKLLEHLVDIKGIEKKILNNEIQDTIAKYLE